MTTVQLGGISETDPVLDPEKTPGDQEAVTARSRRRMMIRRFTRNRLAVAGVVVLALLYLIALFAPVLQVNDPARIDTDAIYAAPSPLILADGGLATCAREQQLDAERMTFTYQYDCSRPVRIELFGRGYEYTILGITFDRHLFAVQGDQPFYLWGTDYQGRDVFSRTIAGSRVSLTIGLLGVVVATALAAVIGTMSGYFRGAIDSAVQRVTEIVMSVPTLPLWAALAAILPQDLSITSRYLLITLVLSLVGWAGLSRQVRGKVMAFAATDFVAAARLAGSSHRRIIVRHLVPNASSHIVVAAALAVPGTIAGETALSFLGLGIQDPAVSWGVMLQQATKLEVVTRYQWCLIPAVMTVVALVAFQLLADGLRDAVDPNAG